ncbi:MAG: hypothetical protein E7396_01970 [Ruminococcaceae bacterium]|nr:hypothetical protein [Oscillospiraceae bacterium]
MGRKLDEKGIPILNEMEELYYRKLHGFQLDKIEDDEFIERKKYLEECIENLMRALTDEGKKAFLKYEEAESSVEAYLQYYNFKKGYEYRDTIK